MTYPVPRGVWLCRPTPLRSEAALRLAIAGPRRPAPVPQRIHLYCDVESATIGGFQVVTLRPRQLPPDSPHLVYLHGGAYIAPVRTPHWSIIHTLIHRLLGAFGTAPSAWQ